MPAITSTTLSRRNLMHEMTSQEDNAWSILAITGTWCFLAVIIVILRVYVRLTTIRYLGWDDFFAVLTMVFGVAIWGCFIGESHSALGKHWQAITPEMLVMYSKWQFAHGMLMVWALHGMKIAFAIFLLRLSNGKIFRRSLFAIMCFMTLYTTASWFTVLFGCVPISESWNGRHGKCISREAFKGLGMTYSILGMLTDAFLAFIPVPIISRMQLNIRTKICLYLAFGMGLATVTCGAIKSYHLWYYFEDRDRLYNNSYFVWGALELYVGTIAACLVSLKPLISSFLEKAKSTLVTSAALAKSLHHHGSPRPHSPPHIHSPKFDEKTEQQFNTFNTQNFPRIQICSVSDYEMPDMPVMVEQPKIFRVEMERNDLPAPLPSYPRSTMPQKSKRKHRPAPLDTAALSRRTSLELPCLRAVITSPSPTHLPSAEDLGFLDLVKGRDPETLSRNPSVEKLSNSRFSNSTTGTNSPAAMTTASTFRSSLSVPNICGLLTSPSPTFLGSATGNDFDFFSLIRCRDPEVLAASKVPSSRRGTVISIPDSILEDHISFPTSRRATLAHTRYHSVEISEASTASVQTMQRINAGEVRRRPSMAPSAASTSSAFLCPPIHVEDSSGSSSMYFHVMTSGQFRSTAEIAAKSLEVEETPLSPMSSGPAPKLVSREQHEYFGFSPVFTGGFEDMAARERIDSSQAALKKDE